jgi:hypothetical protein
MFVVAITNHYTQKEDLSVADLIVTCLGDPGGETGMMSKGTLPGYDGILHVNQLVNHFSG